MSKQEYVKPPHCYADNPTIKKNGKVVEPKFVEHWNGSYGENYTNEVVIEKSTGKVILPQNNSKDKYKVIYYDSDGLGYSISSSNDECKSWYTNYDSDD